MEVYGGLNFESAKAAEIKEVAPGVGTMMCLECNGDPEGYVRLFPPELGITQCVDCKGRGWVYVNV